MTRPRADAGRGCSRRVWAIRARDAGGGGVVRVVRGSRERVRPRRRWRREARRPAPAAAAVSSILGGAIGLAGAVTKKSSRGPRVGRGGGRGGVHGGERGGKRGGGRVGSRRSGRVGGGGGGGGASGAGLNAHDAPGRTLTWRSALVDPPRRVRRIILAPRGPLCAAADSLGRVAVLDVRSAGRALTSAKTLKGCRDAEVAWVEAPPPGDKREGTRSHRGGRGDVPRGEKPAQKRGRGGAVNSPAEGAGEAGRERGAGEAGRGGSGGGSGGSGAGADTRGRECCKPRRRSGAPPPRERPRRRSRRLSRRRGVISSPRTVPSARCPPSARARRKKC